MDEVDFCRKHDIWYLKIDLEIPEVCIAEAKTVYEEGFFVPHRDSYGKGWFSCALHGFVPESDPNTSNAWRYTMNPSGHGFTEDTVNWGWSEIAEYAPEMKRWLEDFPHKKYRRCRYMLLEPGGGILPHDDAPPGSPGRRNISSAINIAFTQPEGCYLRRTSTKEELPFEPGTGFWFDNGVTHEALNDSNENRIHFIIHGGSNKMRKELMRKSLVKQCGSDVLRELNE
jgi:hypothetical protein